MQQHKQHPSFGENQLKWVDTGSDAILAFIRTTGEDRLLAIHNLSPLPQQVSLDFKFCISKWTDLLTEQTYAGWVEGEMNNSSAEHTISHLELNLAPHQYLWLE